MLGVLARQCVLLQQYSSRARIVNLVETLLEDPTMEPNSRPARTPRSPLSQRRSINDYNKRLASVNAQCVECVNPCGFTIKHAFDTRGYYLRPRAVPSAADFARLYAVFDRVFGDQGDVSVLEDIQSRAEMWCSEDGNRSAFSQAPVGFRDRRLRPDKSHKAYFQYCREFGYFMRGFRGGSYELSTDFRLLVDALDELVNHAEREFEHVTTALCDAFPEHMPRRDELRASSVLVKLLAYYPEANWATSPHYDKSALTMVLNASDIAEDRFRIGPFRHSSDADRLTAPDRAVNDDSEAGTAVVFPGMLWPLMGCDFLMPSPHAVMPLERATVRYSAIAFQLPSGLATDDLRTTI